MKQRTCPTCKQKITGKAFEIVGGKLRAICPTCEYKHERRSFPEDLAFNEELANAFGVQGLSLYNARPDQMEVPRRYRTGQHSYDTYRRLVTTEQTVEERVTPSGAIPTPNYVPEEVAFHPSNPHRYPGQRAELHGVRFYETSQRDPFTNEPLVARATSESLRQWHAERIVRPNSRPRNWIALPEDMFVRLRYEREMARGELSRMAENINQLQNENHRLVVRLRELEPQNMAREAARSIDENLMGILRNGASTPPQGEATPEQAVPSVGDIVISGGGGGGSNALVRPEPGDTVVMGDGAYGTTRQPVDEASDAPLNMDSMLRAVEALERDRP